MHGDGVAEHRVDDLPGGFHGVLPGEQPAVPVQGRADEPVIGADVGPGLLRERELLRQRLPPGTGLLPCRVRPTCVSGQIRNLSVSSGTIGSIPNTSCGGALKVMLISVAVTGMHLPARIRIGTPAQRQVSAVSRTATYVSTVEFGSTPSTWR